MVPRGSQNGPKMLPKSIQKSIQNRSQNRSKLDQKSIQKSIKNRSKIDQKIDPKSIQKSTQKTIKNRPKKRTQKVRTSHAELLFLGIRLPQRLGRAPCPSLSRTLTLTRSRSTKRSSNVQPPKGASRHPSTSPPASRETKPRHPSLPPDP